MRKSIVRGSTILKVTKRNQTAHTSFSCDMCSLISKMESIPMVIILRGKTREVCASTKFHWGKPFIDLSRRIIFDKKSTSEIKTTVK